MVERVRGLLICWGWCVVRCVLVVLGWVSWGFLRGVWLTFGCDLCLCFV